MSSLAAAVSPAVRSMIYLGMDVHKDSITIAVVPATATAPTRLERLPNDLPNLGKWLDRVAREGEVHACYEASAGYVLHRALRDWGYADWKNAGQEKVLDLERGGALVREAASASC